MKKVIFVILLISGFARGERVDLAGGRSYLLHLPPAYNDRPVQTLMVLHGSEGSASAMEKWTLFNQTGDSMDWAIAYPDGIDGRWHSLLLPSEDAVDDMEYLIAVVKDVMVRVQVKSLFITGFSAGAVLSYQFAAGHSEIVSGVAAVAGCIGGGPEGEAPRIIHPSAAMPVLIIHGWLDETIPYNGGWFARRKEWICLPVDDAVDLFTEINQCDSTPIRTVEDGKWGTVILDHFQGQPGRSVEVHTYCDMAHCWPRDAEKKILMFFSKQRALLSLRDRGEPGIQMR